MKEKLSRIKSPGRRLLLSLVLSVMVAIDQIRSPRSRVHWIGAHSRPRRLERTLFFVVLFVAMLTFDPHQYVVWSIAWGGAASVFVIFQTIYKLTQRKTYLSHWSNSEFQ